MFSWLLQLSLNVHIYIYVCRSLIQEFGSLGNYNIHWMIEKNFNFKKRGIGIESQSMQTS